MDVAFAEKKLSSAPFPFLTANNSDKTEIQRMQVVRIHKAEGTNWWHILGRSCNNQVEGSCSTLCLVLQPGSHVRCKCKRICECKDFTRVNYSNVNENGMKNFSFSWACVCVCFPYVWTEPTQMQLGKQGEKHKFHQCMPSRHNSKKDDVDVFSHYGRKTWESVRKFSVSVIHGAGASHFPCVCVGRMNSLKFAFSFAFTSPCEPGEWTKIFKWTPWVPAGKRRLRKPRETWRRIIKGEPWEWRLRTWTEAAMAAEDRAVRRVEGRGTVLQKGSKETWW